MPIGVFFRQLGQRRIPAAKAIVTKPVAVYVEKVYELGDLATLGIGT